MDEPSTIDPKEVAAICKKIASKFGLNKCKQCAKTLAEALEEKGVPRTIIRLRIEGDTDELIVMKDSGFRVPFDTDPEDVISETRLHFGVKACGKIYCNVFRAGIKASDWRKQFDCDTHQFRLMELDEL